MVSFWLNYINDIAVAPYFISEAINESKGDYYRAIVNTRDTHNDLTYFLGYILETSIKYSFVYKNLEEIRKELSKTGDSLSSTEWVYVKKILIHNTENYFNYKEFLKYINATMTRQGALKILNTLTEYGILEKTQNRKGDTIFRNCFIDPFQGKMAAQFAQEQGYKTAAVIYAKDDDYSNGLKDAFLDSAKDAGIDVVYTGECTTTDTDFTAQATEVVAAEPDFVFYPCFLDTVPLLVQQVRDAGFEGAIMGGDGWDGADTSGLEDYFTNCYFTNHYSSEDTAPAVQDFVKKYTDTYGDDTLNACAALYYDAMYMLEQAAVDGGGSDTASLVKGMTGMQFSGVGGNIYLDENGDAIKPVVVNTYEDGKIKWLETIQPEGGSAETEA